jgi:hypothetical protein
VVTRLQVVVLVLELEVGTKEISTCACPDDFPMSRIMSLELLNWEHRDSHFVRSNNYIIEFVRTMYSSNTYYYVHSTTTRTLY